MTAVVTQAEGALFLDAENRTYREVSGTTDNDGFTYSHASEHQGGEN